MVSKNLLLIGSSIRKSKTRILIVSLLCILAALLLNTVFILGFDYSNNFFDDQKTLDGPDIVFHYVAPTGTVAKDEIAASILGIEGVKDVDVCPVYADRAESEFGDGNVLKMFAFYPESGYTEKRLDRFEILESDASITEGVYLSYIYKAAQNYQTGDRIGLTVKNRRYEYPIKGFYNSVSTGTINCIDVSCILTDGLFEELVPSLIPSCRITVICDDSADLTDLTRDISTSIAKNHPELSLFLFQTIEDTYNYRYSNATLFQTILLVSSILIIVILLIMIAIVLTNYVKSNIVSLGTLKALGYTSASLILPILLEFSFIITVSSVIGIGASYAVFPLINHALESQIGIPYLIGFMPQYGLLTVFVTLVTSIVTVYLSVRRITYIEPINAIKTRKSDQKANNLLSLDKTNCELNTAIGLKTCLSGISRNLIISVCYLMVSFLIAFSCFLYANIITKADDVIALVCGQVPDSAVEASADNAKQVAEDLGNDPDVASFYQYTCKRTVPKTGIVLSLYVTEGSDGLNKERTLIRGRFAENDNEIAINKRYATDNNLDIGDELTFEVEGKDVGFEIVGLTQGAYYMGKDGYMLAEGYDRIEDLGAVTYYVDLKDGRDIDAWNAAFRGKSPVNSVSNEYKYFNSTAQLYKSILIVLCIVIVILSLLISCFVLYVLISILLESKRREHGILKSLGFITRDIVYQVVLSILPFAFLATVVGTVLSKKLTGPILSSLLNSIGIFSFGKEITATYALLCIVSITVFTVIYTVIASSSIKKITPHELFNKE